MCSYNEFLEAYNNPNITTHDIRRTHHLNSKKYSRIRTKALQNGDIPAVRHMNQENAKYYTKTSNGDYQVQKTTNGKKRIIGRFPNETTAQKIVKACIEHNWEITPIKNLIRLLEVKPKNYTCINGVWVIQKSIEGKNTVFNSFSSKRVDEATVIDIVDFYREMNWNENLKDYVKNCVLNGEVL